MNGFILMAILCSTSISAEGLPANTCKPAMYKTPFETREQCEQYAEGYSKALERSGLGITLHGVRCVPVGSPEEQL